MQDRAAIDERSDVLTYSTARLASPLALAGDVELVASVRSDQPSFDLSAVLSWVSSEGRAFNLTQGYRRIEAPAPSVIRVGMRAVCATIPAGDALRLSLAAADFPAFPVNPGKEAQSANARAIDNQTITLIVHSGGVSSTRLKLPVLM
jgi:putative CocE/NonD family hydrolase